MVTYVKTTYNQFETPSGAVGEPPDGPGGFQHLAANIDSRIGIGGAEYAANLAAITAIPTVRCFEGKLAYAADTKYIYRYIAGAWVLWDTAGVWTTPGLVSGYTAQASAQPPRWLIRLGVLHMQGTIAGTFASGSYTTVTTTTNAPPAGYRPTGNSLYGGAVGQTGRPAGWVYQTDGTLALVWNNGGTTYTPPSWIGYAFAVPYGS